MVLPFTATQVASSGLPTPALFMGTSRKATGTMMMTSSPSTSSFPGGPSLHKGLPGITSPSPMPKMVMGGSIESELVRVTHHCMIVWSLKNG